MVKTTMIVVLPQEVEGRDYQYVGLTWRMDGEDDQDEEFFLHVA